MKRRQEIAYSLGRKIKKIRKYNGMTGKELSVNLGISQQQLSRYENGISLITIDKIYIFCDIFDITISQFLDSCNEQKSISHHHFLSPFIN
ncbi:helix-turn-helix domain-containing protein [Arsenophonus apicola]|jgi:transcriptional regulator with XRE-family HTH domain|uniref:helix-turn-helix domain-containing protein n=1 Tax=Arsenophonus apicola TaxID=2879119 RepID=UPI001CDCCC22|nr:helix-turn-helix transcriptional regulator [Arsenophonus apicola]UBX29200.1 helix-turn-helix domain-containing protein [Arsenophonus apicola]